MADEDVGQPEVAPQPVEQVQHLRLHRDVERRDWLVEHDDAGIRRQRAGDADPLRLATGELVRVAIEELLAQADRLHQLGEPAPARRGVEAEQAPHRRLQRLPDRLARVQRGDRVLEDVLDVPGQARAGRARPSR